MKDRIEELEAQLSEALEGLRRLREALTAIRDYAEASYHENRHFVDTHVPEWVRGDDGPSYPFLQIANRAIAALSTPAPEPQTAYPRNLLTELYQVLGALNAPAKVLDQVIAAAVGDPLPYATLLPFAPAPEPQTTPCPKCGYVSTCRCWELIDVEAAPEPQATDAERKARAFDALEQMHRRLEHTPSFDPTNTRPDCEYAFNLRESVNGECVFYDSLLECVESAMREREGK